MLEEAGAIARTQQQARNGRGSFVDAAAVMRRLVRAGKPAQPKAADEGMTYRRSAHDKGISVVQKGRKVRMEFETATTRAQLEAAFQAYLKDRFDG